MREELKIYEEGLEEYPKGQIIFGNVMIIIWIVLGTVACWFFYPLIAWIYLAFAVLMVGIVLRKLVCINCYYYDKWCSLGWGKLSALLFKKGKIESFSFNPVIKFAPFIYTLLHIAPVVFGIISTIQKFAISKIAILILLILIGIYSAKVFRKKACTECKMRLLCPGCVVK